MRNIFILLVLIIFVSHYTYAQIENPGFEIWENIGIEQEEPVNWNTVKTSDNATINLYAPVTWETSTDKHGGQYSVKLFNYFSQFANIVVAGTMTNGRVHGDPNPDLGYVYSDFSGPEWHTPINYKPDSIAFWIKFFPQGDDTLQFQALLHVSEGALPPNENTVNNIVSYTRADLSGEYPSWTRICLPFVYPNPNIIPEYILIILTSGNGTTPVEGSYALFDDIELIGSEQSVDDDYWSTYSIYISNKTLYLNNLPHHIIKDSEIEIIDLSGRTVYNSILSSAEVSLDQENIISGFYILKLISKEGTFSKKFFIQ